ncbi:MAG: FkbM family methyltransferase [Acidaminococcaceae bacterium]
MLPFIKETETAWDRLKNTSKPIVLYGMGNGADKILDWCEDNGVKVAAIFASDDFVRGQIFRGYKICKYADVVSQYQDFLLVIAFASESPAVLEYFFALAEKHETIVPHLPLFAGDEIVDFSWLEKYQAELMEVYQKLADEKSREVFAGALNYKLSGKISYLKDITTQRQDDCKEIFVFDSNETYVDLGAYDGDTIKEFLAYTDSAYQEIIALEPDNKNFKKLQRYVEETGLERITLVNKGVWSEEGILGFTASGGRQSSLQSEGKVEVLVDSVDHIMQGRQVTYMKLDVEGAEFEALNGARETIGMWTPKLFVAAYHHDNDLWCLPLLLWCLNKNYKIYLRKHPYVPVWELNFLAVTKNDTRGQ